MHMPPNFQYNITRQPAGNGPPAGRGEAGCVAVPACVNQFGLDAVPACEPAATAPSASYGLEVVEADCNTNKGACMHEYATVAPSIQ